MIQRGRPPGLHKWSLPGGRVEPGETVAAAVEREVAEEVGIEVACGELIGWVEHISADHHFVIMDFDATVVTPNSALRPADDAADAAWVPLRAVAELDLVDGLGEFLADHGVV